MFSCVLTGTLQTHRVEPVQYRLCGLLHLIFQSRVPIVGNAFHAPLDERLNVLLLIQGLDEGKHMCSARAHQVTNVLLQAFSGLLQTCEKNIMAHRQRFRSQSVYQGCRRIRYLPILFLCIIKGTLGNLHLLTHTAQAPFNSSSTFLRI